MAVRADDALTRWANRHRTVAGALFGVTTALVVSVPMAMNGEAWSATLFAAVTAGLFTGVVVGLSNGNGYDRAGAARPRTKHSRVRPPEDSSRRDKVVLSLGGVGFTVFIIVAALLTGAKQLSYPGLAAWLILPDGMALWFWMTRDRDD